MPRNPFDCGDFVGIENWLRLTLTNEYGTDFVFHDSVQYSPIAKVGQGASEFDAMNSKLLFEASMGCFQMRFAGCGMSATGVGPDAGPGFFRMGSLLSEHASIAVEEKYGECAMQRRIRSVNTAFVHGANGSAIGIQEDDMFCGVWLGRGHLFGF